jgi:cytochrome c2
VEARVRRRALASLALAAALACGAGERERAAEARALTAGGRADVGRRLVASHGCDACHTIPGIPGADRTVGPSLAGFAGRAYIGGVLVNSPTNLVTWLRNPPAVDSATAMPATGLDEREARDVAAYLYTLR